MAWQLHPQGRQFPLLKSFGLLEGYVQGIKTRIFPRLTYEYEGFYRELMEESIPEIMKRWSNSRAINPFLPEEN